MNNETLTRLIATMPDPEKIAKHKQGLKDKPALIYTPGNRSGLPVVVNDALPWPTLKEQLEAEAKRRGLILGDRDAQPMGALYVVASLAASIAWTEASKLNFGHKSDAVGVGAQSSPGSIHSPAGTPTAKISAPPKAPPTALERLNALQAEYARLQSAKDRSAWVSNHADEILALEREVNKANKQRK